jgi:putative endonuclease
VDNGAGPNRNTALGRHGEERVARWYRSQGYAILERNWRCRAGEIDLICAKGDTLVICEVKTRTRPTHGHPLEAVTPVKQRRLRRLAATYLVSQSAYWAEIRFDVATVLGRTMDLLEGAF